MPTETGLPYLFNDRFCHLLYVICFQEQSGFSGPSTSTVVASFTVNGQLNDEPNNVPVTTFGQCDRVRFEVVNPGSIPVPIICGENSGEHSSYTNIL